MSKQHAPTRDYSSLFLGVILAGLAAIVFFLMIAVAQSRVRAGSIRPVAERMERMAPAPDSGLTPIIYFDSGGTI
ncbi:MAG: hypothetical protein AB1342_16490 [Pseudomonadota bacterium]|jgi:hypothetical protein